MKRQKHLYLIATLILLIGLGSAIAVYVTADSTSENASVQEFELSKKYHRDVEVYGGQAGVFADQFNRWFDSIWHGESLAYTIACITIVVSGGIFFVGNLSPSDVKADAQHKV